MLRLQFHFKYLGTFWSSDSCSEGSSTPLQEDTCVSTAIATSTTSKLVEAQSKAAQLG